MSGVPEQPARLKRAASSKNVRDVLGLGHPAWLKVLLVGDSSGRILDRCSPSCTGSSRLC